MALTIKHMVRRLLDPRTLEEINWGRLLLAHEHKRTEAEEIACQRYMHEIRKRKKRECEFEFKRRAPRVGKPDNRKPNIREYLEPPRRRGFTVVDMDANDNMQ